METTIVWVGCRVWGVGTIEKKNGNYHSTGLGCRFQGLGFIGFRTFPASKRNPAVLLMLTPHLPGLMSAAVLQSVPAIS